MSDQEEITLADDPSSDERDEGNDVSDLEAEDGQGEGAMTSPPQKKGGEGEVLAPSSSSEYNVEELEVPRMPGPIEKLILLGNSSFKEAVIPWELAEQLRYDREVAALGDGTRPAVAGAKLTPKSKSKGKGKAKEVDPIAEPSLPSSEEFLEREKSAFALAQTLFVRTEKYYQRAMNLIDETGEGIDNEFYPVTCLNLGECCLRRGDDEAAKSWIRPIVSRIDIPGRMSGAMVIAAQDLILEPAQVWWPNLMPEQPKKPVTKKSKKGGKKGGKKSGKGKGKGKKKK